MLKKIICSLMCFIPVLLVLFITSRYIFIFIPIVFKFLYAISIRRRIVEILWAALGVGNTIFIYTYLIKSSSIKNLLDKFEQIQKNKLMIKTILMKEYQLRLDKGSITKKTKYLEWKLNEKNNVLKKKGYRIFDNFLDQPSEPPNETIQLKTLQVEFNQSEINSYYGDDVKRYGGGKLYLLMCSMTVIILEVLLGKNWISSSFFVYISAIQSAWTDDIIHTSGYLKHVNSRPLFVIVVNIAAFKLVEYSLRCFLWIII